MSVLLTNGNTPSVRLELRSPAIRQEIESESEKSILDNKKRFALRLEGFLETRVSEETLVTKNILQDLVEGEK
mgnify:CR=1 FL=1